MRWWMCLGLDAPTRDPEVVWQAYLDVHPNVSVIYGGDEARAAEVEAALEEGIRYCQEGDP